LTAAEPLSAARSISRFARVILQPAWSCIQAASRPARPGLQPMATPRLPRVVIRRPFPLRRMTARAAFDPCLPGQRWHRERLQHSEDPLTPKAFGLLCEHTSCCVDELAAAAAAGSNNLQQPPRAMRSQVHALCLHPCPDWLLMLAYAPRGRVGHCLNSRLEEPEPQHQLGRDARNWHQPCAAHAAQGALPAACSCRADPTRLLPAAADPGEVVCTRVLCACGEGEGGDSTSIA